MHFITILCLALLTFIPPAFAEKLSVGTQAPSMEAINENAQPENFESLTGEKGLVLVFVRSVDWCPYCQIQLLDLDRVRSQFEDLGYQLAAVSYDAPDKWAKFKTKYRTKFKILSDTDSQIIKSFGLLNEEFAADHFAYGTPHPAIYVIGADKTVKAAFMEEGYKNRPDFADILTALRE